MASHPNIGSASALPFATALAVIPSLPRPLLSRLVSRAIERLDEIDGDPDLEDDDPSGQCDEDEINTGLAFISAHGISLDGPGCPISDPGEPEEGSVASYGTDQRIAAVGHGYPPWHIDKEAPA